MTDLEVLSRAVVLSRSDYEFGSSPGRCTLPPGAVWPADNSEYSNGRRALWLLPTLTGRLLLQIAGDFEAEQSLTMGTFLAGAIPFGSPLRHYTPYATRSAGPAAKTVRTETTSSTMIAQ